MNYFDTFVSLILRLFDLNFQLHLNPKILEFSPYPKKSISGKMVHAALDHCSLQFIFKSLFHGSGMSDLTKGVFAL
jgi:hypothetical protein